MSLAKLLRTLLSLGSIFASAGLLAQGSSDEELFELTPFEVTGGTDDGYRATSTLAGTRLRTDMRDIGSSISIVNEEFLRDTDSKMFSSSPPTLKSVVWAEITPVPKGRTRFLPNNAVTPVAATPVCVVWLVLT